MNRSITLAAVLSLVIVAAASFLYFDGRICARRFVVEKPEPWMPNEVTFYWDRYQYVKMDFGAKKTNGKWALDGLCTAYMWPKQASSVGKYELSKESPAGSVRQGAWKYYREDGSLEKVVIWHDGKQISDRRYTADGEIYQIFNYDLDGQRVSPVVDQMTHSEIMASVKTSPQSLIEVIRNRPKAVKNVYLLIKASVVNLKNGISLRSDSIDLQGDIAKAAKEAGIDFAHE